MSSDKVNHYLLRRWFCLICLLVYHILPVLSLVIHYISIHPCHQHYSCNKKIQGLGFLVLHWQIENFLDSANRCGIAGVLHEVVADLYAGCAIHGSDLNDHVQRFTLIYSAARIRAEVVREVCPDTECCLETNFVALLFQTEGFVLV